MENNELIKQCTEKAQTWLTAAYDAETQAEVKAMLENPDKTDLIDAFYKDLEFGTGGLRGIMGAGSNRMNIYTVGAATQGLANYLNKCFAGKKDISVVVGHDCRNNSRKFAEFLPTSLLPTASSIFVRRYASYSGNVICYPSPGLPERYQYHCFSQPERIQRLQGILGRRCTGAGSTR